MCSLSKVYDKLLMWCFYSGYDGIYIGIDKEKANQYLSNISIGVYIGAQETEVQYKDLIDKPDYFRNFGPKDLFHYQLSTKAKDWEYEQEVRFLLIGHPFTENAYFRVPIGGECFCELYLGVEMDKDKQDEIANIAHSINPEMKIFKMTVDPGAFRLKAIPFCDNH